MEIRDRARWRVVLLAAAVAAGTLTASSTAGSKIPVAMPAAHVAPSLAGREIPTIGLHPRAIRAGKVAKPDGQVLLNCQVPAGTGSGLHCYGPDQIRAAYRIQPLLNHGITGKGRTIVIIGAYAPPNVAADLHTFDGYWGVPDPQLQILAPQGVPAYDPTDPVQFPWAAELAVDTQWAHVVAPAAKIVLVEARSVLDTDVLAAIRYAVDRNLGDVISMSFGEAESCVAPAIMKAEHELFARATRKGITLIAGAGDLGAAQVTCDGSAYFLSASSPASDPDVLAVGGTALTADLSTGKYASEAVWNDAGGAGGGGYSSIYAKPSYQHGSVPAAERGVPDVSYNASSDYGVPVYISSWGPGTAAFYIFGGTSTGVPQWAGLTALAGQIAGHRLGAINAALYTLARHKAASFALHDITVGDNSFVGVAADGSTDSVTGYSATKGWDAASGLGTPIAIGVVPYLALAESHHPLMR